MLDHLATHLATPLKTAGFNLELIKIQAVEAREKDDMRKAESIVRNSKWRKVKRSFKEQIKVEEEANKRCKSYVPIMNNK